MASSLVLAAIGLAGVTVAQSGSVTFANPKGYSTKSFNYTAATTYLPNTDYSNERLQLLWDQVGPISTAAVTTVVEPTPEPSPFPQPASYAFHPAVPAYVDEISDDTVGDDFVWGVASSALQVEGAADADGKGPSVWDLIPHRWVNSIADNTTADIASNNYYYYKVDNARLKALGIQSYSFSVGWARVFPFGSGPVNPKGVEFYDNLISDLVSKGINPVVTLFHWDTPLALFDSYGAWTSKSIVADYVRYAKYIIERYDKYVHTWYTFNEPQYCNWRFSNYPYGTILPSYNGIGTGGVKARFLCGHYTLLAHAEVYNWYKHTYGGKKPMTMKNSANLGKANGTSAADKESVTRYADFNMGWFGQCWTETGDYPTSLKETLGDILPKFTAREKEMLKGSCDFYAIDGYTAYYTAPPPNGIDACASNRSDPNYPDCLVTLTHGPDGFPIGPNSDAGATWLWSTPTGIREFLSYITKVYFPASAKKGIVVSEIGFADPYEQAFNTLDQILWDLRRADYMQSYLDNILAAKVIDKVNVTGAYAWAIMDNFEWNSGLGTKFGLQYVNLTSYERHPKASMFQFVNWFKKHGASGPGGTSPGGTIDSDTNTTARLRHKF